MATTWAMPPRVDKTIADPASQEPASSIAWIMAGQLCRSPMAGTGRAMVCRRM